MRRRLTFVVIMVPLGVVFLCGITCAKLADVFGWLDDKCRTWFEEMYHGQ
jgi:hypothetical protein